MQSFSTSSQAISQISKTNKDSFLCKLVKGTNNNSGTSCTKLNSLYIVTLGVISLKLLGGKLAPKQVYFVLRKELNVSLIGTLGFVLKC